MNYACHRLRQVTAARIITNKRGRERQKRLLERQLRCGFVFLISDPYAMVA
jgi:hypothetical protein